MADAKRSSVTSGKAAVKGPQAVADLSKAIGAKIRITTALASHYVEGSIFAVDASMDLVAIRAATSPTGPAPATGNYHVIPISQISSFKILSAAKDTENEVVLGKVDTEALRQREEKAIAEAKKVEANIGKGVTKEAQEIFDHISRTLPVRWADQTIVVSDSVLVESPYSADNLKAPNDKQRALQQIKRVVDGYWQKKKSGSGASTPVNNGPPARAPVPAVPLSQRKGG